MMSKTQVPVLFYIYWRVDLQPNMKVGLKNKTGSPSYKLVQLDGLASLSNIGRPGMWMFEVNSFSTNIPPPVDANWGPWVEVSQCSVSCGGGTKVRNRTCLEPPVLSMHMGDTNCPGDTVVSVACNVHHCPGELGAWGEWGECSVSCDSGYRMRTRNCNSTTNTTCLGDQTETEICGNVACESMTYWRPWSDWSMCSATCGYAYQMRSRECQGHTPGSAECPGVTEETQPCGSGDCPDPVNGNWGPWTNFSSCSSTCGWGVRSRLRKCDSPPPQPGGRQCDGLEEEPQDCWMAQCDVNAVVNGVWSPWSAWDNNGSACSVTCGQGTKTLVRTCDRPAPANGGAMCVGNDQKTEICTISRPCIVDGQWGQWNEWHKCSHTCYEEEPIKIYRYRYCDGPNPAYGGQLCDTTPDDSFTYNLRNHEGSQQYQETDCDIPSCSTVHGSWGPWTKTTDCSRRCGGGRIKMVRQCKNPTPTKDGRMCPGGTAHIHFSLFACNALPCPSHGQWSDWSEWSQCTVTCGLGREERYRDCNAPPPRNGGLDCEGHRTENIECNMGTCHINGSWSEWSSWTGCGVTCGGGMMSRTRECNNPSPNGNGTDCMGLGEESVECNTHECPPVDGGWGSWIAWTMCTEKCGFRGIRTRVRKCNDPSPIRGGKYCIGNDYVRAEACNRKPCMDEEMNHDGNWGEWTSWTQCPVTCGEGKRLRFRTCDSPSPKGNGSYCGINFPSHGSTPLKEAEGKVCAELCPVDGAWGHWSAWSNCSALCGGGTKERVKRCDSPPPANKGKQCLGIASFNNEKSEKRLCNEAACPDGDKIDLSFYADNFDFLKAACSKEDIVDGGFWPFTNIGQTVSRACPLPTIGRATRLCNKYQKWEDPDTSECKSAGFDDLVHLVASVPKLQKDEELLLRTINVVKSQCEEGKIAVESDLKACVEAFGALVDTHVTGDNRLSEEDKKIRFDAVLEIGNQLLSPTNKPHWTAIAEKETDMEISSIVTMARWMEDLCRQLAECGLKFNIRPHCRQHSSLEMCVEAVPCGAAVSYSFPRTPDLPSAAFIDQGSFTCTGPDHSSSLTMQPTSQMPPATTSDATTIIPTTIGGASRRRRQAELETSDYWVYNLLHSSLIYLLPTTNRRPYVAPYPWKNPRTGSSEYKPVQMVNAPPISIYIIPEHRLASTKDVILNFTHILDGSNPKCGYLVSHDKRLYNTEECHLVDSKEKYTLCECPLNRGTYVLLATPKDTTMYKVPIHPLLFAALIIGIVVHLIILFVYLISGFFKNDRHFMALNFLSAFTAAQLVALLSVLAVNNDIACKALNWFIHFLLLSAMFWVLCIAGYSFTEVRSSQPIGWCRRLAYLLVGWGIPAFLSIITVALYDEHNDRTYFCWYPYDHLIFIAYGLPLGITALLTVIFLLVAYSRLSGPRKDDQLLLHHSSKTEQQVYRRRYLVVMLLLLGMVVCNLVMFGIVIPLAFLITNIIQAIFDLVLFLVIDEDAFEQLWRCCIGPEEGTISAKVSPEPQQDTPEPLFAPRPGSARLPPETPLPDTPEPLFVPVPLPTPDMRASQADMNKAQVLDEETLEPEDKKTPVPPAAIPGTMEDVQDEPPPPEVAPTTQEDMMKEEIEEMEQEQKNEEIKAQEEEKKKEEEEEIKAEQQRQQEEAKKEEEKAQLKKKASAKSNRVHVSINNKISGLAPPDGDQMGSRSNSSSSISHQ